MLQASVHIALHCCLSTLTVAVTHCMFVRSEIAILYHNISQTKFDFPGHCKTMATEILPDVLAMIGVTHAGTYCLLCKSNFPPHLWRRHFNRNHPDIFIPKKLNNIANILNHKINTVLSNEDPSRYREDFKIYRQIQCLSCNGIFRDKHQLQNHLNSINNPCGNSSSTTLVSCYRLLCGRMFPVQQQLPDNTNHCILNQHPPHMTNNATMQTQGDFTLPPVIMSPPAITRQHTCNNPQENTTTLQVFTNHNTQPGMSVLVTPSQTNIHNNQATSAPMEGLKFMQYFCSIPSNNTVNQDQVEAIIHQLIDRTDTTDYWLKILHKFIATNESFIESLTNQLSLQSLKPEVIINSDGGLKKLMDLFIALEGNIKSIADGIPANWKAALVKFEVSREQNLEIEGATTWNFRYRQNSSPQLREFGYLLCYLKHFQCPIMTNYYQYVNRREYCHQTAFRCGIVAKFIYELTTEHIANGDYIPWICKFSLYRCFKMDGFTPKLKRPNVCSKQFATILYLLREGVLTCSSMMLNGGHSDQALNMLDHVQKSHVINMISPWISYTRAMNARSNQKESSHLASNGDIICNNSTFRKCIYSQLIPLVRSSICEIYQVIFEGEDWRAFLSNQNQIRVSHFLHI